MRILRAKVGEGGAAVEALRDKNLKQKENEKNRTKRGPRRN